MNIPTDPLELARACASKMYDDDLSSRHLGIEVTITAPGCAEARMTVASTMVNGHDICHGGYVFTLADSAFAFACNSYNRVTVAAGASIEFLAPGKVGDNLKAFAREMHRGGRAGLYDVRVTNQEDKLIALFRGHSATLKDPMFSALND